MFILILPIIISICFFPIVHGRVSYTDFVPFGPSAGDAKVPVNDDGSSPEIALDKPFTMFGSDRNSAWVNTNGAISFSSIISSYKPSCTPVAQDYQMVSPFWADVNNYNYNGGVYYRQTTDQAVLDQVQAEVEIAFPSATRQPIIWAFVATWNRVTHYGTGDGALRNTLQAILATNERHSFVIFYYYKITWTYGTASNGLHARAGFDAGDGENFYLIDGSCSESIIDLPSKSNVNKPGVFVFQTDQREIITPAPEVVNQDSPSDGSGTMSTNRCYITKPKCKYDSNVAIGCADGIDGEPRTCISDNLQCLSRGKCKSSIGWCLPTTQDMRNFNKMMNKCF